MTDLSRDPSDYYLSTHAGQQAKYRDISKDLISETIADGEVKQAHKPHQREFVKEYPHLEDPIGVVVDPSDTEIITVQWRYK